MRHSPPVRVQGHGGTLWRAVNVALPALAVASLGLWAARHLGVGELWAWVLASKLAAVTAAVAAALPGGRRRRVHELHWDGQQWLVDGQRSRLRLMLDLGPWMLLQARPDGRTDVCNDGRNDGRNDGAAKGAARGPVGHGPVTWLPLAASEAGAAWGPLRAAVHAHPAAAQPARPVPEQQTR